MGMSSEFGRGGGGGMGWDFTLPLFSIISQEIQGWRRVLKGLPNLHLTDVDNIVHTHPRRSGDMRVK